MIDFAPHDLVALNNDSYVKGVHKAVYAHDYEQIFRDIASGELDEKGAYRYLILNDLFFIVYFVMGIEKSNHPFVVNVCNMVQTGAKSDTLDIWARFHFKAVDINETVLTTKGWKKHGDLKVGDRVFSPSGKPTTIKAKTKVFTDADCYRVLFSNGSHITASGDHLWEIGTPDRSRISGTDKRKKWKRNIVNTRELMGIVEYSASTKTRPYPTVEITKPLEYDKPYLPIDPYVLGVWLGDGSKNGSRITSGTDDAVEMESLLKSTGIAVNRVKHSNCVTLRIGSGIRGNRNSSEIMNAIREYNLNNNKHIPEIYKTADIESRFSLLQGLMDTDGSVHKVHSQAIFCNTNLTLIEDVFELCVGLGLNPTMAKRTGMYKGKRRDFYQIQYRAYSETPTFRLERKKNSAKPISFRTRVNRVIGVTPVCSIPVSCIQVESKDGMYLVGKTLIPTHNSTIITIAESLQYELKNPEHCTSIYAYARPAAKKHLRAIKNLLETSDLLKWVFPDILWDKPETQAPKWSEDDGLVLKRKSSSRGESSFEAWGLTEGMPMGRHYERNVYDDLETEDIRESPDMLDKVYRKFEMAVANLGTGSDNDIVRIIGTYYSYFGPNIRIRDKKFLDDKPMYQLRLVPASSNGQMDGEPVLMDRNSWEKIKLSLHFNSQQLCDPTPSHDIKLDKDLFRPVEPEFIPKDIYKFMIIDQAGDAEQNKSRGDLWSFGILGIQPQMDDIGASKVFLLDVEADQMSHSEAINSIVQMYLRNGFIMQLGVEKVGLATTEIHIQNALRAHGRRISANDNTLITLSPAGRSKVYRVEAALQWPLNNSKLYYSTGIQRNYIDMIRNEMDKFPFYHVDILDMMAYAYDLFKKFRFQSYRKDNAFLNSNQNRQIDVSEVMM